MELTANPDLDRLRELFGRRGWTFSSMGTALTAHRIEWPAQLKVVVDAGSDSSAAILGLAIDFRSMPLRGERFRDIFNNEREDLMRGMGSFRVRQLRGDSGWTEGVNDQAFLRGIDGGVSRHDEVVLFDRCPTEQGQELAAHFNHECSRLVETGNEIAGLLQRIYNRTVLRGEAVITELPEQVAPSRVPAPPVVVGEPTYPWRR